MAAEEDQEFRELTDRALEQLSDEALIDYVVDARDAGAVEVSKRGAGVLAWGFWGQVRFWVAKKVPAEDVEDVAMEAIQRALRSNFDGKLIGQFGAWLKVIASRTVADYWRARERTPGTEPLPGEHQGDDEVHGAEEGAIDDGYSSAELRTTVERVLGELENQMHKRVVLLYGPIEIGGDGLSARETVKALGSEGEKVTESNVHQIWKRFKSDMADALREDGYFDE